MKNDSILHDKFNPPPIEWDDQLDDDEIFRLAMAEVTPLSGRCRVVRTRQREVLEDEGDPGFPALLRQYIESHPEMEWLQDADYVEGGAGQSDPRLLKKLRQGGFSVQAELDLHGLYQEEAQARLENFIQECVWKGHTCVRVIHGKGNNSPNRIGVLKYKVRQWLGSRRLSRYVVAYTSARRVDGGAGALYVLLKRTHRGKKGLLRTHT